MPSVFVAAFGAILGVALGSQRLSSSKGQNRRKTATQSYGPWGAERFNRPASWSPGCRRAWAGEEPVRPRDTPRHDVADLAFDPRTGPPVTPRVALLPFPRTSTSHPT